MEIDLSWTPAWSSDFKNALLNICSQLSLRKELKWTRQRRLDFIHDHQDLAILNLLNFGGWGLTFHPFFYDNLPINFPSEGWLHSYSNYLCRPPPDHWDPDHQHFFLLIWMTLRAVFRTRCIIVNLEPHCLPLAWKCWLGSRALDPMSCLVSAKADSRRILSKNNRVLNMHF